MLFISELNFNRLVIFFAGLILFIISPTVCEKAIFHYTTGTLIGVLGSILIIVYLTSRLFPKVYEILQTVYSIISFFILLLSERKCCCCYGWWKFHSFIYSSFIMGKLLCHTATISLLCCGLLGGQFRYKLWSLLQIWTTNRHQITSFITMGTTGYWIGLDIC